MKEFIAGRFRSLVHPEAGDIHPVDFLCCRQGGSGNGGNGRQDINRAGQLGTDSSSRNAWPPHDTGDSLAAFEGRSLTVPERPRGTAMMPEGKPWTIVCGVDHVGILGQLQLVEGVQQAPDLGIDMLDSIDVGVLGVGVAHVVWNVERNMGHGVGQIDKERILFVGLHKVYGLLGASARDGALVDRQLDNLFILEKRSLPLGQRRFRVVPEQVHALPASAGLSLVVRMVHVVGVGNAKVGIEAVGGWQDFRVVTEMPLAKAGCGVVLPLQVVCDGMLVRVQALL